MLTDRTVAEKLIKYFINDDGEYDVPEARDFKYEDSPDGVVKVPTKAAMKDNEEFMYLGSGVEVNAYLHVPSNTVYKIPNTESLSISDFWSDEDCHLVNSLIKFQERAYTLLNSNNINKSNIRYAETEFYFSVFDANGNVVPIIVQEFLPVESFVDYSLSADELCVVLDEVFLDDLHSDNIRKNVRTGEIVLFDCLYLPLDFE